MFIKSVRLLYLTHHSINTLTRSLSIYNKSRYLGSSNNIRNTTLSDKRNISSGEGRNGSPALIDQVKQKQLEFKQQLGPYIRERMSRLNNSYDEIFGLSSLRKIQESVVEAESKFVEATNERRRAQERLKQLHTELQYIREKIDASPRSSDVFLELITREHSLIKEEIQASNLLRQLEEKERALFERLSKLVSRSHEFERLRQEKAKYISLLGSIIGALMGIVATSLNHAYRVYSENKKISSLSMLHQIFPEKTVGPGVEQIEEPNSSNETPFDVGQLKQDISVINENLNQVINSTNDDWMKLQELLDTQSREQRKMMLLCLITCICTTYLTLAIFAK